MAIKKHRVVIAADGIRFIHDDTVTQMLSSLGTTTIRRASQVEQFHDLSAEAKQKVLQQANGEPLPPLGWYVDLTISDGPVYGPFPFRQAALDWEVEWLEQHNIPVNMATGCK